ncbi:hypothetical protein M0R45_007714 [Rubus argutus]|uniref:Uncharacterized protein n=1 Tax=Rubus argutus TaxID=59490 RepID=A0AAW1XZF7_RUBAR
MEQMMQLLSKREPGRLPSQTEVNPKRTHHEQVNAVTLRNGRQLVEVPKNPKKSEEAVVEGEITVNIYGNEEGKRTLVRPTGRQHGNRLPENRKNVERDSTGQQDSRPIDKEAATDPSGQSNGVRTLGSSSEISK